MVVFIQISFGILLLAISYLIVMFARDTFK